LGQLLVDVIFMDAIDARTIAASGVPSSPTEHNPLKIDGAQQQKTEILS
jgi:hypothetical protein